MTKKEKREAIAVIVVGSALAFGCGYFGAKYVKGLKTQRETLSGYSAWTKTVRELLENGDTERCKVSLENLENCLRDGFFWSDGKLIGWIYHTV